MYLKTPQRNFGGHTMKIEKSNLKIRPCTQPLRNSLRVGYRAGLTSNWWIAKIKTHFFQLSKHNQYAKPSAKAFDSFHPLVLIVGRSEKNAFEKFHLNKSEVAFLSKLTHNPKKFSTQLVCVLFKNGCSLFHIPGKSEHCFFTLFEDFSIMWRLDTLSLGIWGLHSCTKLVALH